MNLPALLTLRYDPSRPMYRRRLTPADFTPLYHENIERRITDVVKDILPHLDKVTVTLSGGIDSHFTLSMFRKHRPDTKVECVTVGFDDDKDETKQAVELARRYDVDCRVIIKENILEDLETIIPLMGEPRWNVYPYYIFQNVQNRVVYTGDGGDELWAGYVWRYRAMLEHGASPTVYLLTHKNDWVDEQHELIPNFQWGDITKLFSEYFDNTLHPVEQAMLADFNGKLLYDYIPQSFVYSKHFDLDIRSLFLSARMVELATHTPWQLKYDGNKYGKLPLRKILNVWDEKRGFGPNLKTLWERQGKELYRQYIHESSAIVRKGIISKEWIMKEHPLEPQYINKMLQLVALEIWHTSFKQSAGNLN